MRINCDEVLLTVEWNGFEEERHVDIDLSIIMIGTSGKVRSDGDLIFYNNTYSPCQSVSLLGPTSEDSKDQSAGISLKKIPAAIRRLIIVLSIYDEYCLDVTMNELKKLKISLFDAVDRDCLGTFEEIVTESTHTGRIIGELSRLSSKEWSFRTLSHGTTEGLRKIATALGVVDDDKKPTLL